MHIDRNIQNLTLSWQLIYSLSRDHFAHGLKSKNQKKLFLAWFARINQKIIGSFSKDNCDGNRNGKNTIKQQLCSCIAPFCIFFFSFRLAMRKWFWGSLQLQLIQKANILFALHTYNFHNTWTISHSMDKVHYGLCENWVPTESITDKISFFQFCFHCPRCSVWS